MFKRKHTKNGMNENDSETNQWLVIIIHMQMTAAASSIRRTVCTT